MDVWIYLFNTDKMRIKYLGREYYYKPEYQLADFIRVNQLEWYDISKVLKIMVKLYVLSLDEDYPWYINPYAFN